MTTTYEVRQISVAIARDWRAVYDFAKQPENAARWAAGLGATLKRDGEAWIAEGPGGPVGVRFSAENAYGVLDHWVRLPSGVEIYIPLRVVANGEGCEVLFTLYRYPPETAENFARDAGLVETDLATLKAVMEGS